MHLNLSQCAVAFPANVTATYKGSWPLSQPDNGTTALPVLKQGQGTIAFQLHATPSGTDQVLDVQVMHSRIYIPACKWCIMLVYSQCLMSVRYTGLSQSSISS